MAEQSGGFLSSIGGLGGLGSLFSGLGSLGGLLGGGGGLSPRMQMAKQYEYQRLLNQTQVQDRVSDAKAAGVSPLFALGANLSSPAPSVAFQKDSFMDRLDAAGQGIARAGEAYADARQRKILFDQEVRMNELKIKNAELANATSASDLAVRTSGATPPYNSDSALLIPGQGNSVGLVANTPSQRTSTRRGDPSLEAAGPAPSLKAFMNADGTVTMWPSQDAKQSIEDSPYEYEHFYKNRIAPMILSERARMQDAWDKTWWRPKNWRTSKSKYSRPWYGK